MNFTEVMQSVELILESGSVPLLVGESGIGKTALVKEIASNNNYKYINIDGNLLKEGEIGGLPVVEEYEVKVNNEAIKRKRTVYAVHTKLQEIDNAVMDGEKKVLLFIDEINRCEHAVQQELMNIILNREINGYILPKEVNIIAAMNPSSDFEEFNENQYGVVEMDPAQKNRFVWIELESDVNEWIRWGTKKEIHEEVLSFISTFPEYLHKPKSTEYIKATPRSWERVSEVLKVYYAKKDIVPEKVLYNIIKGNVGGSIAQELLSFIKNNKNPLIKPEDMFKNVELSEELINRIKKDTHSRLYLAAKNALFYLNSISDRQKEINIFSKVIQYYPPDLKLGIMREIKRDYSKGIYEELLENEIFIEGYFKLQSYLEE